MKLLYICHNNKGRSPSFKAFTEYFLALQGFDQAKLFSAGVDNYIFALRKTGSTGASRITSQILRQHGLDISAHVLTHVRELTIKPDLVLASDEEALHTLQTGYPHFARNALLAGEYADCIKYREIYGPLNPIRAIKTETEGYRKMIGEIKYVSKRVARRLVSG